MKQHPQPLTSQEIATLRGHHSPDLVTARLWATIAARDEEIARLTLLTGTALVTADKKTGEQLYDLEMPPDAIPYRRPSDNGRILWFMTRQKDEPASDYHFTGTCYVVTAWNEMMEPVAFGEAAVICLKWDGCAHVGLRDPELDHQWLHVCGGDDMENTLAMLRWMWVTAQGLIAQYDETEKIPRLPAQS